MILNCEMSESMLLAVAVKSPPPPPGAFRYFPLLVRKEYVGVLGSNIVEKRNVSEWVIWRFSPGKLGMRTGDFSFATTFHWYRVL